MLTLLFNGQSTSEPLWPENLTHFQDFSIDDRIFPVIASRNTTANSCLGPAAPRSHSHKASVLRHRATARPSLTDLYYF